MRSYGQFCPIAKAAELFCERWTALIIRDLAAGVARFSELHRGVPLMSPTLLSRRLKQLEAEGVVERRRGPGHRSFTYHLTNAGLEFAPLVHALGVWGQRWSRRQLADDEIDLGLFLWTVESCAKADAFGAGRTVVRLELTDQPVAKRLWWFLNQEGRCELCLKDPGFEVDLYVSSTLPTMIYVIRGDVTLARAMTEGMIEALGMSAAQRCLGGWLDVSPLSKVQSVRNAKEVRNDELDG
jgi:DNA-binding HxlR family transcriptional regulator